jgi:hypothetical protein
LVTRIFQIWNKYFFPSRFGGSGVPSPVPAQVIDNAFVALQEDGEEDMEAPVVVTYVPMRSNHANPSPSLPAALHHQAPVVHPIPAMDGDLENGMAALVWDRLPARVACAPS